MPPVEIAALLFGKLQEARDLTGRLRADPLQYLIDMAILEAAHVEKELLSKGQQEPQ
jgi:hypothetical protein